MTKPILDALISLNLANQAILEALQVLQHEPEVEALLDKVHKGESRIIGALKAMNEND